MGRKQSIQKEKSHSVKNSHFLPAVLFLIAVLLTFLAYYRSLHSPLIFDDLIYIRPAQLKNLSQHLSLHVRSIAKLSFALDYHLWGMNLAAFRITNIVFHILSTLSVFYLTYITLTLPSVKENYEKISRGKTPLYISLFAACLFLLHPIQTSAVNYITQRMAIMAGLFSFIGLIFYVKGAVGKGRKSTLLYGLSALSFILAVFSKENAVMVLFMLPVFDFFFLSSHRWREFRNRFITISALLISLILIATFKMGVTGFMEKIITVFSSPNQPMEKYVWAGMDINWTPIEYLLTELRVVSRYIFLIVFPFPSFMIFDYSNAYPVSKDLFNPLTTIFSLFFLASILFLSLRYRKKAPLVAFGILWYLATISLESFIALGLDPYFEHRNYIPAYGLFIAVASFLAYAGDLKVRVKTDAIILVVALALFGLTLTRNGVWRDGKLLWGDAVEKVPENVRARINLGIAYANAGNIDRAIEQYQIALRKNPDDPGAHLNMGVALFEKGLADKAIEEYQSALVCARRRASRRKPDGILGRTDSDIYFNLGAAFQMKGLLNQAIENYRTALNLRPDFAEAHVNMGIVYGQMGSLDEAQKHFLIAVQLAPEFAEAHNDLGAAYARLGRLDEAIEQYRIAVKLKPDYASARNDLQSLERLQSGQVSNPESAVNLKNMGDAYFAQGLMDQAIERYQAALKSNPGLFEIHNNLGNAFYKQGTIDKAIEQYRIAMELNPKSAEVHNNLGACFLLEDLLDKAIEQFQAALKLKPDYVDAHKNMGDVFYKKNLMDKAIEQYQIAVKLHPGIAEVHQKLGDALYNKNLMDKAIEQYEIVVKLQPDNSIAYYNLGVSFSKKGLMDKARECFAASIKLNPRDQRFREALATVENLTASRETLSKKKIKAR